MGDSVGEVEEVVLDGLGVLEALGEELFLFVEFVELELVVEDGGLGEFDARFVLGVFGEGGGRVGVVDGRKGRGGGGRLRGAAGAVEEWLSVVRGLVSGRYGLRVELRFRGEGVLVIYFLRRRGVGIMMRRWHRRRKGILGRKM